MKLHPNMSHIYYSSCLKTNTLKSIQKLTPWTRLVVLRKAQGITKCKDGLGHQDIKQV